MLGAAYKTPAAGEPDKNLNFPPSIKSSPFRSGPLLSLFRTSPNLIPVLRPPARPDLPASSPSRPQPAFEPLQSQIPLSDNLADPTAAPRPKIPKLLLPCPYQHSIPTLPICPSSLFLIPLYQLSTANPHSRPHVTTYKDHHNGDTLFCGEVSCGHAPPPTKAPKHLSDPSDCAPGTLPKLFGCPQRAKMTGKASGSYRQHTGSYDKDEDADNYVCEAH